MLVLASLLRHVFLTHVRLFCFFAGEEVVWHCWRAEGHDWQHWSGLRGGKHCSSGIRKRQVPLWSGIIVLSSLVIMYRLETYKILLNVSSGDPNTDAWILEASKFWTFLLDTLNFKTHTWLVEYQSVFQMFTWILVFFSHV